jgi:CubicO group peptidase (beta-lactamase class C family)
MLKFCVLYLNDGIWDQKQILPESWIGKSAHPYPGPENQWWKSFLKTVPPGDSTWGKRGYGYTWWTHELRTAGITVLVYYALGFGGQRIYVLPEQETLVVFTSGNYTTNDVTFAILQDFVIPAIEN